MCRNTAWGSQADARTKGSLAQHTGVGRGYQGAAGHTDRRPSVYMHFCVKCEFNGGGLVARTKGAASGADISIILPCKVGTDHREAGFARYGNKKP